MLQDFNVKYIILHKDVDWLKSVLYNPQETEVVLDGLEFLDKKTAFRGLVIYKLKDNYFNQNIKLMNNIQLYLSSKNNISPQDFSTNYIELPSVLDAGTKKRLFAYGKELLISPESFYRYYPQNVNEENLLGEMPATRILPDSPLYLLIRLKEIIQFSGLPSDEKLSFKLTLAGKRLVEVYLLKEKGSKKSTIPLLNEYQKIILKLNKEVLARTSGKKGENEISVNFIFSRHLAMLELIKNKVEGHEKAVTEEVLNKLNDFVRKTDVIPNYQTIKGETLPGIDRLTARFDLPFSGTYELLQVHQQVSAIYPNNLSTNRFQINNEAKKLKGSVSGNYISYGELDLQQGLNEISFNSIPSINLARINTDLTKGNVKITDGQIEINSDAHDSSYIDITLDPVNGGNWYQLTFDSWIKFGNKFRIQIFQDTDTYDRLNPGMKSPYYDSHFNLDLYNNYWKDQKYDFYIRPTTTKVFIRLEVAPWDGCVYLEKSKNACFDKIIKYRFEQPSQIILKNINVFRILRNPIFLKYKFSESINTTPEEITFTKENVSKYSGKINITKPAWLFFGESFDSGWELTLTKDKQVYKPIIHLIGQGFANAWLIEKEDNYGLVISYRPQQFIQVSRLIAGLGWTIMVLIILRRLRSRK